MDRAALRAALTERRRALPPEERVARSARLVAHLAAHPWVREARVVAAYHAVGGEPSLAGWIDPAARATVLPRTVDQRMTLHLWRGEPLLPGVFRIPEPGPDLPLVDPENIDLWLVPGVAFDRAGNRLGRGAGHYDRALANAPGRKVGVAWTFQVVDAVPAEPHDVPMDALVTEEGWIPTRR